MATLNELKVKSDETISVFNELALICELYISSYSFCEIASSLFHDVRVALDLAIDSTLDYHDALLDENQTDLAQSVNRDLNACIARFSQKPFRIIDNLAYQAKLGEIQDYYPNNSCTLTGGRPDAKSQGQIRLPAKVVDPSPVESLTTGGQPTTEASRPAMQKVKWDTTAEGRQQPTVSPNATTERGSLEPTSDAEQRTVGNDPQPGSNTADQVFKEVQVIGADTPSTAVQGTPAPKKLLATEQQHGEMFSLLATVQSSPEEQPARSTETEQSQEQPASCPDVQRSPGEPTSDTERTSGNAEQPEGMSATAHTSLLTTNVMPAAAGVTDPSHSAIEWSVGEMKALSAADAVDKENPVPSAGESAAEEQQTKGADQVGNAAGPEIMQLVHALPANRRPAANAAGMELKAAHTSPTVSLPPTVHFPVALSVPTKPAGERGGSKGGIMAYDLSIRREAVLKMLDKDRSILQTPEGREFILSWLMPSKKESSSVISIIRMGLGKLKKVTSPKMARSNAHEIHHERTHTPTPLQRSTFKRGGVPITLWAFQ